MNLLGWLAFLNAGFYFELSFCWEKLESAIVLAFFLGLLVRYFKLNYILLAQCAYYWYQLNIYMNGLPFSVIFHDSFVIFFLRFLISPPHLATLMCPC